ncbi:MAG: PIN domain-containing protein [Gammaproteobacteria bacterium]|nr:PIN domain-containing protein [Gammaproteobacteria bacterium]MCY4181556.1 PIN domain-containing protein [Gammaproteobacteria bacterium]
MKRIFVDTGAWYALVDQKDPDHAAVAKAVRQSRGRMLTTNFIIDETLTLVRTRLGWNVAQQLGNRLRVGSLAQIERISPRDEEAAWTIFTTYSDKRFSFTDCTSFAVCDRMGLLLCLAIDQDFRSFGLQCVP